MYPEIRIIDNGTPSDYSVAEAKAQGINQWKDWTCSVGIKSMYIDFDGVVWRGPCRVGEPLGHILTGWNLPTEEIVCTRNTCDCGSSIKLPKRKNHDVFMIPLSTEPFHLQWDLGRKCNFDCSYCWPSSHSTSGRWWRIEDCYRVIDHLLEQIHGSRIQVNFAGGEPTLYTDLVGLFSYINKDEQNQIHLQTNGTMSEARARMLAMLAEISISVHFEQANLDKLCRNITAILEERGKLEVKMMIAPNTDMKRVEEFKERLRQIPDIQHARIIFSPLRDPDTNDLMDYHPDVIEMFGDYKL